MSILRPILDLKWPRIFDGSQEQVRIKNWTLKQMLGDTSFDKKLFWYIFPYLELLQASEFWMWAKC